MLWHIWSLTIKSNKLEANALDGVITPVNIFQVKPVFDGGVICAFATESIMIELSDDTISKIL